MKACMGSKVWQKTLGELPPTEPAAHGQEHTDEGGYVNGVQAQPWPLPVLQRSLQFEIDDSCPSMSGCCGEDCSCKILSYKNQVWGQPACPCRWALWWLLPLTSQSHLQITVLSSKVCHLSWSHRLPGALRAVASSALHLSDCTPRTQNPGRSGMSSSSCLLGDQSARRE